MSEIACIINSKAGPGNKEQAAEQLEQTFRSHGQSVDMIKAGKGADMRELAHQAVQAGSRIIVAAGGDGTVNAVASALVGAKAVLGVIPLGTLNHFAKDLALPLDVEGAVLNIIRGNSMAVDVGEVNDRFFLNNSSVGLYPSMVLLREQQQRQGRGKWAAFAVASFRVLRRYPALRVRVVVNGEELRGKTPFVFIGNNEYELEGFHSGRRKYLNKGTLGLYMARGMTRTGLLSFAVRGLTGRLRPAEDFYTTPAREIRIESRRSRMFVSTDGEVTLLSTPLHYRVHPAALQVVVPAE